MTIKRCIPRRITAFVVACPVDPRKRAPGVNFDRVDPEQAEPACRAAVAAAPDEPRCRYELGRVLQRARDMDKAVSLYRAAAEQGYAIAANDLAAIYENGMGTAKDGAAALHFYRESAESGFVNAFASVGRLFWDGAPGVDRNRAEAIRWFEHGAAAGDPFSHQRLAQICEVGDEVSQDLDKALLHYAIATRLLEAAGLANVTDATRARRGSLARALPPETAVRIAYTAMDWKPGTPP